METPRYFMRFDDGSKLVLQINTDGSIILGEGIQPNDAAIQFYQILSQMILDNKILQRVNKLEAENKKLKEQIQELK